MLIDKFIKIEIPNTTTTPATLYRLPLPGPAPRPAMLVVPGGGYEVVTIGYEGVEVAQRFAELGFQPFVLDYHIAPNRYPLPQHDLIRAIRLIRHNAEQWGAIPDNLAVCGFSAGGHLTACAATIWDEIPKLFNDDIDQENGRPDAVILSYPVISAKPGIAHEGSFRSLLGDDYDARHLHFSLEDRVTANSSPAFLWHTATDQVVPWQNSLLFFQALRNQNIPTEMHLFPEGTHGLGLGFRRDDLRRWPEMARYFVKSQLNFRFPEKINPKKIVLTFDDCCRSHYENVMPILQEYGFGGTFFISRFPDWWQKEHADAQMTKPQVKALADAGFEIGNHTMHHPDLNACSPETIAEEFDKLNEWLQEAGVPKPVSFAYPGGPYAPNARQILRDRGILYARTTDFAGWHKGDDLMRIPAISLQHDEDFAFYNAMNLAENSDCLVLVYHGVPDDVHQHATTSLEYFKTQMKYLYDHDYQVMSLKDAMEGLR